MFSDCTEGDPPEDCDEALPYIIEFLAGKNLYPVKKLDRERRESHDREYQKYKNRDNKSSGAPKKYREEAYNRHSRCDAQFINNLHHYKTCDRGSGYRAEQKHYAMDFVAERPCGSSDRSVLKNLQISSKNRQINDWLNREDNPKPKTIRKSVSCINLSLELPVNDKEREKIAEERRFGHDFTSTIKNVDPSFLSENPYGIDTSKFLAEVSIAVKQMIRRVNTQSIPLGDVKISKVLFSTEDHYAYVLLEGFDQQKALRNFSADFENWHNSLSAEKKCEFGVFKPKRRYFEFVNVVLFLEEFIEKKTAFRRARHICKIPGVDDYDERQDLYFEIDTGIVRQVESTAQTVRCMPQMWARFPAGIVEVRFRDADSDELVAEHIARIRKTGLARVTSFDTVTRVPDRFSYRNQWNSHETLVLQTYLPPHQPNLTSQFCSDKDCIGLCTTDAWFQKPTPVQDHPPQLEKLVKLRERFLQAPDQNQNRTDLSAYIIPYTDAHQNQVIPEHFARLKFLADFTGTFGTALVTYDKAVLWTDNMHFKIAQNELNRELWIVKNQSEKKTETIVQFLRGELPEGSFVGFDPMLITYSNFLETSNQLASAGIRLVPIASNLIDEFWDTRPYRQGNVVKIMSMLECGKSPERKLKQLREELRPHKCTATVISTLEDVMWILNLKGNDLPESPVTYSYLFVTMAEIHLFIDLEKIDRDARAHLTRFDVQVHAYRKVHSFISEWFDEQKNTNQRPCAYLTPDTSYWIGSIFGEMFSIINKSLVHAIRARKDVVEIGGMRECNLRDSVAMVEFMCWVERELAENKKLYSEVEMADRLETIKKRHPSYEGLGRKPLFSSGPNSAKPAHRPDHSRIVSYLQQYLIQSGGHYKNGTSTVTRTVWNTYPTPEFASNYTMVLKGHVQVAMARFPPSITSGSRLDVFAKKELWMQGYDSVQDTGHGVGHCFNVRDSQGDVLPENDGLIEVGQVISLEPSFYEPGKYGIQIGNCYETVGERNQYLAFQPITLVPFQTSILVKTTLTPDEILWINRYHYRVFVEVGAVLSKEGKPLEYEWLRKACEPI